MIHNLLSSIPEFTNEDIDSGINAIRAQLAAKKLDEKLQHLESVGSNSLYQTVFIQLAAAQCCIDEQKNEIALSLYKNISDLADKNSLSNWMPKLMVYILLKYYQAFLNSNHQEPTDVETSNIIYQRIVALAPSYAILLNRK